MSTEIPIDVERAGEAATVRYLGLLGAGNTPLFAEMLALRSAPRVMTDSVFFSDIGTLDKQFGNNTRQLEEVTKRAKARGYKPSNNDFYNPALARFIGDPEAFIPAGGGRGHVARVCEQRGLSCEGAVSAKGREPETDPFVPKYKLNPRIVRRIAKQRIAKDPSVARMDKRDLAADIIEKHGQK